MKRCCWSQSRLDTVRLIPRDFSTPGYRVIVGGSHNTSISVLDTGAEFKDPIVRQSLAITSATPVSIRHL